jgi:hypothetical protein
MENGKALYWIPASQRSTSMDIQTLTSFFMWCTVINTGMLLFLALIFMLVPDLVYRLQSRFMPISRETFNLIFYAFIGFFKAIVLVFNVVPWIALLIIG